MVSASLFDLKASAGHSLASASAKAGNGKAPRPKPAKPPAMAPFRTVRRASASEVSVITSAPCARSARVEEIDDRLDFLVGQNEVALERRHHRLRIALGLVGNDGDELLAIWKSGFHVG